MNDKEEILAAIARLDAKLDSSVKYLDGKIEASAQKLEAAVYFMAESFMNEYEIETMKAGKANPSGMPPFKKAAKSVD